MKKHCDTCTCKVYTTEYVIDIGRNTVVKRIHSDEVVGPDMVGRWTEFIRISKYDAEVVKVDGTELTIRINHYNRDNLDWLIEEWWSKVRQSFIYSREQAGHSWGNPKFVLPKIVQKR